MSFRSMMKSLLYHLRNQDTAPYRDKSAARADTVIHTATVAEDRPKFKRVYTATVGDGFKVEITMRTSSYLGRLDSSCLTQKNGKWILFHADAVADKIIDRDLYPLVQAAVDKILALDKAYIASKPFEFTDEIGTVWQRVGQK